MAKPDGMWIGGAAAAGAATVAFAAFQGPIGLRIALPLVVGIPIILAAPGLKMAARGGLAVAFALLFGIYALAGAGVWPQIYFSGPAMLIAGAATISAFRTDGVRDKKLNFVFVGWVVAILIAVLIGLFSGPAGSGGIMRRFLESMGVAEANLDSVLFAFRKSVHIGCYLVSALMAAVSLRGERLALLLGAVWTIALAIYDEWNQASFPDRTGTPMDLIWDGVGMLIGLFIAWLILRKKD